MAKLGDAWYGEVSPLNVSSDSLRLLTHAGNREGSKPTRRTCTGRSEVQLEKWGVGCLYNIEYASCTMTTPLPLQLLTLHGYHYNVCVKYMPST
jgi:hypothetical protein